MQAEVLRSGDDLILRLPEEIAAEGRLREGQRVEIAIGETRIAIARAQTRYVLSDLLKGVTPQDMREAFSWGSGEGCQ